MAAKKPRPLQLDAERVQEFNFSHLVENDGFFDPHTLIFDMGANLIEIARAIRGKYANSYRDFKVGAATISINESRHRAAAFVGANSKPTPSSEKFCAEKQAVGSARANKFMYTPAVFVVGSTDKKEIEAVTGLATPTLHPCTSCRNLLSESTVVIPVGADEDVYEAYTGKHLWELYDDIANVSSDNHQPINDYQFMKLSEAKSIYLESTVHLRDAPEEATRMIRADAVVAALHEVA